MRTGILRPRHRPRSPLRRPNNWRRKVSWQPVKNARSGDRAYKNRGIPEIFCRPRALTRRGGGFFDRLLAGRSLVRAIGRGPGNGTYSPPASQQTVIPYRGPSHLPNCAAEKNAGTADAKEVAQGMGAEETCRSPAKPRMSFRFSVQISRAVGVHDSSKAEGDATFIPTWIAREKQLRVDAPVAAADVIPAVMLTTVGV